jgi:hypothetical protein
VRAQRFTKLRRPINARRLHMKRTSTKHRSHPRIRAFAHASRPAFAAAAVLMPSDTDPCN